MFVDSLKKLKARDKRIADLAEAHKAVAAENAALREHVAARPAEPNGAESRLQVRAPLLYDLPWLKTLARRGGSVLAYVDVCSLDSSGLSHLQRLAVGAVQQPGVKNRMQS